MTFTPASDFLGEMKKITSMQPSGSREQDRNNARDAWKAANIGIHKKKINKKVAKKKVEKKKKVEEKDPEEHVESDSLPAPTWERCMAFWDSCFGVGPITPEMFK